jgi:hypothetical protein
MRRAASPLSSAEKARVYRQRLRASGGEEVLFKLPSRTVAMLDDLKERQGLRNRSQALLQGTGSRLGVWAPGGYFSRLWSDTGVDV